MVMRVLLAYLAVEFIAVIALAWAFGPLWAIVAVLGAFLLGPLLVGSRLRSQFAALRQPSRTPDEALTDGLLVAAGSTLILVPGLVSTALGGLMLATPTRDAMRPLARVMVGRGLSRRLAVFDLSARPGRGDYIDGEIVDGAAVDGAATPPNLPAVR